MITTAQEDYIERHAYVPEHIPQYVTPISQTEPYLFGDYLVYAKKGHFILVGYPLKEAFEEKRLERALEEAVQTSQTGQRLSDCPCDSPFPSTRFFILPPTITIAWTCQPFPFLKKREIC